MLKRQHPVLLATLESFPCRTSPWTSPRATHGDGRKSALEAMWKRCSDVAYCHVCDRVDQLPLFPYNRGWENPPKSVGVFIPIVRIPIKGWMTIPNTRSLDLPIEPKRPGFFGGSGPLQNNNSFPTKKRVIWVQGLDLHDILVTVLYRGHTHIYIHTYIHIYIYIGTTLSFFRGVFLQRPNLPLAGSTCSPISTPPRSYLGLPN